MQLDFVKYLTIQNITTKMTEVSNVGAGEQQISPHSDPSLGAKKVYELLVKVTRYYRWAYM